MQIIFSNMILKPTMLVFKHTLAIIVKFMKKNGYRETNANWTWMKLIYYITNQVLVDRVNWWVKAEFPTSGVTRRRKDNPRLATDRLVLNASTVTIAVTLNIPRDDTMKKRNRGNTHIILRNTYEKPQAIYYHSQCCQPWPGVSSTSSMSSFKSYLWPIERPSKCSQTRWSSPGPS